MSDWTRRLASGGLLVAQILLLAVAPSADARLESEAAAPHAGEWASLARSIGGAGVHDSHSSHDHRLCQLCRALSAVGGPAAIFQRLAKVPERRFESPELPDAPAGSPRRFFPVVPRAPPTA